MKRNFGDSSQENKFIPLFQEEVIRQANRALVNLQWYYKTPLVRIPDGLFSCKTAGDAHIEWIELILYHVVVDCAHSRFELSDPVWPEKFSHSVITTLKNNGIDTLLQLYLMTVEELSAIDGIGEKTVKYIHEVQRRLDTGFFGGFLPNAS